MATSGEPPGSTDVDGDADGTTRLDRIPRAPERPLSDDHLTVVRDDGVEIVVDDDLEVVRHPAAPARPRAPWRRLWWAGLGLVALVVAAIAWIALRGDDTATRVTTRPGSLEQTTVGPAGSTTPTAPASTLVPVGNPGASAPTPTPAPSAPATAPTTPPTTHDPTDLTGLVRSVTTPSVTLAPGAQSTITVRATNTASWTMHVGTDYCGAFVDALGVCAQGSVLTEVPPGGVHERPVVVTAPATPGTYTYRISAPLDGWQSDVTVVVAS